jgi:predicted transcriptional regulator of viral defense system
MTSAQARIGSLAAKQRGLITREQLRALGLSDRVIDTMVRQSALRRIRRSVYATMGAPETWERSLLAAVLAAGDGAAASHSAAARLWRFAYAPEARLEIITPRERRPHIRGVHAHQSVRLESADITRRDGIPCTTFERTLCDCTSLISQFQAGRTLDDGLRRNVAKLAVLRECAERLESAAGRRMTTIRALLAQRGVDFDPGGSGSELRVLDVIARAGLPRPVQQHRVRVGRRTYILDYAWPQWMVFGEYYGLAVHSGASAVAYDSDRITDLSAAGWTPLIFTDATPDSVIAEKVAAALGVETAVSLIHRIGA